MALFSKKREPSPEELAALEENKTKLQTFNVTKALGIKKQPTAMQFIFDKEAKKFVVVEGPEETFKERNPWVVDFDQVTGVALEVEESWSEDKNPYAAKGFGTLLQERYDEVWWRYNFNIIIKTTHPFAGDIRFQTNVKPNILRVPNRGVFVRRGLELNGEYRGSAIADEVQRLENMVAEEPVLIKHMKTADILTGNRPDDLLGKLKEDYTYDMYLKTLERILKHVKRANRISKMLDPMNK